jgi:hypothetical protein
MIMKNSFLVIISALLLFSCKKEQVGETRSIGEAIPWPDSSSKHPKNATQCLA